MPPNIARTLASLGQYIYAKDDESLFVNLYISNNAVVEIGESKYHIEIDNNYPMNGTININIHNESSIQNEITVALRIPEYAEDFQVTTDGIKIENLHIRNGYAMIRGSFIHEKIAVRYKEEAKFVHANPFVRSDVGKVAIVKGPFVYCLEEVDNGDNLPAIYVDTKQQLEESYDSELLGGITVVSCHGKKVSASNWDKEELYKQKKLNRRGTIKSSSVLFLGK